MELRHTQRLFVDTPLAAGGRVEIVEAQAHYLLHVLRVKMGEVVRLFNGRDGEVAASVAALGKKSLTLAVERVTRARTAEPDSWLCCAPIKKAHFDYMVEKATELGVAVIQPILTQRTQIREVNIERLRTIAIEAAEQANRLTVPEIRTPLALADLASRWEASRHMIVCAEYGEAAPVHEALAALKPAPAAIITGPEGGFAESELEFLRQQQAACFVRLGPRILRADTAAIAALACWQSQNGDWRNT